jgi:uncharacterized membrane protein YdjX (TVP38/TMEM64 family)
MTENSDTNKQDDGSPDGVGEPPVPNFKRAYFKTGMVVFFLALFVVLLNLTAVGEYLNVEELQVLVSDTGAWAPLVFLGLTATLIFVGAPRLIFCTLGGALFGFVEGLALVQMATLLGSLGPFLFARWSAREWVTAKLKSFNIAQEYLQNPSVMDVFLLRHIPIWGVFINLLLGSNNVRLRTFLIGSFFGFLPQGIVFTLIGSGIGEESTLMVVSRVWCAILVLVIAAIVTRRVTRRDRRPR